MENGELKNQSFWSGFFWGLAVMLFLSVLVFFIFGYGGGGLPGLLGGHGETAKAEVSKRETRSKLNQLAEVIDELYYKDVDSQQIADGLYHGLLASLGDPYSEYYNPEEYQEVIETTSGSYCGIGAAVRQAKDSTDAVVRQVYPNSPAQEIGLMEGDVILEVDGIPAEGEELTALTRRIKGPEGSSVHLKISRLTGDGTKEEILEFQVERREVQVLTVESSVLKGQIGYLGITEFAETTAEQFSQALEELNSQGIVALIVDLRGNPGGTLDGVCDVLDQVLPEGLIVYTEDKYGNRNEYRSSEDTCLKLPLAVLINENSASAAEIFAGAVKDHGYGTLIGKKTFGKGIVQRIVPLKDGSALKVTTASYYTPAGNNIHGVGITPDIECEYEYSGGDREAYDPLYDSQISKAYEILEEQVKSGQ